MNTAYSSPILSVNECTQILNTHLQSLGELVVQGEISSFSISQGKWIFMEIKDDKASLQLFGVVHAIPNYRELAEGMLVQVTGSASIYPKTGKLSLQVWNITPAGEGAMQLAFEKLRQRLEAEGLFAIQHKKALPPYPENIGLLTASGSRAYSDFTTILSQRLGGLKIYFFPVLVQGKEATDSIIKGISYANTQYPFLDVLILTRGGGSLEDLIAFNDEAVARAVFASTIPMVCAIGHEADVSLAELAADMRASTPSNAAERIVRDRRELLYQVSQYELAFRTEIEHRIENAQKQIDYIKTKLKSLWVQNKSTYDRIQAKFVHLLSHYQNLIEQRKTKLLYNSYVIACEVENQVVSAQAITEHYRSLLEATNHDTIKKRGYAVIKNSEGTYLTKTSQIKKNSDLLVEMVDDTIQVHYG